MNSIERANFFDGKNINWYSSDDRHEVIRLLVEQRPNLLRICRPNEIDNLLYDCVENPYVLKNLENVNRQFLDYVVASGYRNEPIILNNFRSGGPRPLPQVTALHPLGEYCYRHAPSRLFLGDVARKLFQVYHRFDINCIDVKSAWTHLQTACVLGLVDQVREFLRHGHDPNYPNWREMDDTPLHMAARSGNIEMMELLLSHGAKPTLKNKERLTPLDILFSVNYYIDDVELVRMMLEAGGDEFEADRIHEWLRWAVVKRLPNVTKLLLKNGADPTFDLTSRPTNYVRQKNRSTLAMIFRAFDYDDDDLLEMLSTMLLQRDLLKHKAERLASMLVELRRHPNARDAEARTALHVVCSLDDEDGILTKWFFYMLDCKIVLRVDIDARDKNDLTALHLAVLGRRLKSVELLLQRGADPNATCSREAMTPLQFALSRRWKDMAELLLKNGVDPNSTNAEGLTPLAVICKSGDYPYDGFLEQFLKICDDLGKPVRLDVKDNEGQTALQAAVATLRPSIVDVLLDRGADLSSFVFPTEDYFGACFFPTIDHCHSFGLQMVSGALRTIESLEKRGYELKRSDALTITKFFKKHEVFVNSSADLKNQYYDEEELEKIIVYRDDGRFVPSRLLDQVPERYHSVCFKHRCEKLARQFCRAWAIECLMEMTRSRLPLECCEKIIDHGSLTNTDLCNICLSAENFGLGIVHKLK
ncbi:unnamed protein product [Trichogramma brassicae]|uniref:Uncharacterized protein n=1 Tax=Trichogramma brassicae TaxID=86971 RepID=A0A6H5ILZ9_9HYME|nr:unnamed protein product [Trichogramma brassicae]